MNRKQSEVSVFLPRELEALEPQARDEINRRISRGRLTVRVSLCSSDGQPYARVRINTSLAKEYAREFQRLAAELRLPGSVSLELLARAPGVLQAESGLEDAEKFWPSVQKALRQSLSGLVKMREKEGSHLAKDLGARIKLMRKAVARVEKQAPRIVRRYREQLDARIRQAGAQTDPQRLAQEIVLFTDRSDISEELTRLQSHLRQFEEGLKSAEPVGRTLDFLAQEMNREVNTLGAKGNDSAISREVILLKTELERIREQVQNVE